MKLPIPSLFRRKQTFSRASARYSCQLEAQLMLVDRMLTFEGRVIDISRGGAMFRPHLAYIMYRRDVAICLTIKDEPIMGQIVTTTPAGFGLRFDELIDEDLLRELVGDAATQVAA